LDGDFQQDNPALFARFQCGKIFAGKNCADECTFIFVLSTSMVGTYDRWTAARRIAPS
jgi:hypothetical protein